MRAAILVLLAITAVLVASACGGDDDGLESTPSPSPTDGLTPTEEPASVADLAKAVVQVEALDFLGDIVWTGSGTFISPEGLILTNAHVVDDRFDEYDTLGIAVTRRSDAPPELAYKSEIVAVDYALDLAVIRITSAIDGGDVDADFPFVSLGDSDTVEIGADIRILGYPGIGGETITFTNGVISGFTSERSIEGRAWIKTDATIAGGNSGGLAVDSASNLIGVPTIVGSGAEGDFVDCRLISDTNRDGSIDELDTCVPVGGFINGLRPVNLALALIDSAESGQVYVSQYESDPEPAGGYDTTDVFFDRIVFSTGVTPDDQPADIVEAVSDGTLEVCAFWEYEGMANGMTWEAVWFIDGDLSEDGSFLDQSWTGGESGSWWVCVFDELSGLTEGLYELILSVEGESLRSNAIFVGGNHPNVDFVIDNQSTFDICYVYASPSGAQNWGTDDLGIDDFIPSGESFTLSLPSGTYDVLTADCTDETVTEDYDLDLLEDSVYTITDL